MSSLELRVLHIHLWLLEVKYIESFSLVLDQLKVEVKFRKESFSYIFGCLKLEVDLRFIGHALHERIRWFIMARLSRRSWSLEWRVSYILGCKTLEIKFRKKSPSHWFRSLECRSQVYNPEHLLLFLGNWS